jgi:hypothetical protein
MAGIGAEPPALASKGEAMRGRRPSQATGSTWAGEDSITRETMNQRGVVRCPLEWSVGSFKGFYRQGQPIVNNYEFPEPNWAELRARL